MLNKVLAWAARVAIGRQLVGGVSWINGKLTGKRSEVIIGLEAVLWVLKHFGVLGGDLAPYADALSSGLIGALPVTLAEKIKKAEAVASTVIPKPVSADGSSNGRPLDIQ